VLDDIRHRPWVHVGVAVADLMDDVIVFLTKQNRTLSIYMVMSNLDEIGVSSKFNERRIFGWKRTRLEKLTYRVSRV
jgi:hypothetical protein